MHEHGMSHNLINNEYENILNNDEFDQLLS